MKDEGKKIKLQPSSFIPHPSSFIFFIVSGRRAASCPTPQKKMLDAGCWMLGLEILPSV
jgi:hypothetical protein